MMVACAQIWKPLHLIIRLYSIEIYFDQFYLTMKNKLSRRTRYFLFTIGLVLVLCGISAIVYAFWPLANAKLQEIISATLFAPP